MILARFEEFYDLSIFSVYYYGSETDVSEMLSSRRPMLTVPLRTDVQVAASNSYVQLRNADP